MKNIKLYVIFTSILLIVLFGPFVKSSKLQSSSNTSSVNEEGCKHYFDWQTAVNDENLFANIQAPIVVDGFDFPVGATNGNGWLNNLNGLEFLQQWNYGGGCGLTYHPGHDFNKDGTTGDSDRYQPVYAVAEGVVVRSAYYGTSTWGNVILIKHTLPNGTDVYSQYGHLEDRYVQDGNTVTKRQQIGRVGKGDGSLDAHLHFEMRKANFSANAFPCGQSQSYVTNLYHNPINFINQNRTLQQSCPISPGQGASGSELAAFQNAYNIGTQAALGCPTSNVNNGFTSFNGTVGRYQTTQKGEILYHVNGSLSGRAFAIEDPLRTKWASYPFNNTHLLGYPTSFISQETGNSCYGTRNRYQNFERGALSQHSGNVFEVHEAIYRKWELKGFAGCPLGLPTSDERAAPQSANGGTGRLNWFQGGRIYWKTGASQAYEVHGSILSTYLEMGESASWLGFPTSDEFVSNGQPQSNFEGGYITWNGTAFVAFPYSTSCSYSISPTSQSFSSSGGNGTINVTINVTTNLGCSRTATSNVSWISITSGGSGSGSGTVGYSVLQNTTGAQRQGTITVAGQTFTVGQSAGTASCSAPSAISFGQTVSGTLQGNDCRRNNRFYDAYTFNGTAGQKIYVALNSPQFDTYLYLYRGNYPGGSLINWDDDGGDGYNSRIPANGGFINLPYTGTYTVLASSWAVDATGSYALLLSNCSACILIDNNISSYDFNSDRKADYSVFRPSNGVWYIQSDSKDGYDAVQFGMASDKIIPADYDGDYKTDIAVFRDGTWHLLRSSDEYVNVQFGQAGDIPQPADYDGDGKADIAVYRPSNRFWYILGSATGFRAIQWGAATDKPVVGDYDGDGKADFAVWRPSSGIWYIIKSRDGFGAIQWGLDTDKLVPGDYDGDGKTDVAVYRPSNGYWYLLRSQDGFAGMQFGMATDLPIPGDYDGDGKTDAAVYRDGIWYQIRSSNGFSSIQFGLPSDKPIPNAFVQ